MMPSVTPKATTVSQSDRVRPRVRGRAMSTKMTELVTSRSHTSAVGSICSNRSLANAAPELHRRDPGQHQPDGREPP